MSSSSSRKGKAPALGNHNFSKPKPRSQSYKRRFTSIQLTQSIFIKLFPQSTANLALVTNLVEDSIITNN